MAKEVIGNIPKWTGCRRRGVVNMPYAGGQVQYGKATRDSRLTVDLEQLMQMAIFDCEDTLDLHKCRGMGNRLRFGMPMGGYDIIMSSAVAVITKS